MFNKYFAENFAEAQALSDFLNSVGNYCVEIHHNLMVSWLGDTEIVWDDVMEIYEGYAVAWGYYDEGE